MLDPNVYPKLEGPVTFVLESAVKLQADSPDAILPSVEVRKNLNPNDYAKLAFRITDGQKVCVERMWVNVRGINSAGYVGRLDNDAYCTRELQPGMLVEFSPDHVIGIDLRAAQARA